MLFVCAAGNNGNNVLNYPSAYNLYNIISVAATDDMGNLASFSSYGSTVDVAAPGVNIYSTVPIITYDSTRFYLNETMSDQYGIITDTTPQSGWEYIGSGNDGVQVTGNARSLIYLKNSISLVGEPSGLQSSWKHSLYGPDRLDVLISNMDFKN